LHKLFDIIGILCYISADFAWKGQNGDKNA
jgi:hypothetical protein